MPSVTAKRLCPFLTLLAIVSELIKKQAAQSAKYLTIIPNKWNLSLDEAYLDVTNDLLGIGSATKIADLSAKKLGQKLN